MPAADTVLLPICVALSLLGVIITAVAWRQRRTGRAVQGVGLVIAPVALYLSGLLRLGWDFAVSIVAWAGRVVFSPPVWIGLGLLGLCIVLWVVGGVLAKRSAGRRKGAAAVRTGNGASALGAGPAKAPISATSSTGATRSTKGKQSAAPADPEMAEIEALLKSRGID
ncbi:MAG: hypothetical protein ACR2LI_04630 [Propionibacteriaceae bacterium]